MATTAFISDLHLDPGRPEATARFAAFLEASRDDLDRLYILGDLFEVWIGDDHDTSLARDVAHKLAALRETGTDLYFMAGNRDFLLGPAYAARCGMRLLADPCVILVGDEPLVLSHGDRFCTDDHEYQAFRRQVRDPVWIREFLARPLDERLAFAERARAESRRQTGEKTDDIMDCNADAIRESMHRLGIRTLLHGHTHRPAVHDEPAEGCRRYVLGDWFAGGGIIALADGKDIRLTDLRG